MKKTILIILLFIAIGQMAYAKSKNFSMYYISNLSGSMIQSSGGVSSSPESNKGIGVGYARFFHINDILVSKWGVDFNYGLPYKNYYGNDVGLTNVSLSGEIGFKLFDMLTFSGGLGWAVYNSLPGMGSSYYTGQKSMDWTFGEFYPSYGITFNLAFLNASYRNYQMKFGVPGTSLKNEYSGHNLSVGFSF